MSERGAPTAMWPSVDGQDGFDLARADARLVVHREGLPDVTLPIERPEFLIGRALQGVDLTLDDEAVSRQHARLSVNERGYFRLEDLGSTNGIIYQGRRVKRLNLVDGDVFEIGEARLEFFAKMDRFKPPEPPKKAPPRQDSVFADVSIPEPGPDVAPAGGDDEVLGWDPRAAAQTPAPEGGSEPDAEE
ncbi:MAG: FHA domain-containing protein [Deltaproteobacteria bacterium]|nr:FHA domain-containing protein [Deltaproteobacteria bacterium]